MIIVIDNFFDNDTLERIKYEMQGVGWKWNHNSVNGKTEYDWLVKNLNNISYFTDEVKNKIELKMDIYFNHIYDSKKEKYEKKQYILERVYANGMMYGSVSDYHIDNDDENAYTFIYYTHNCFKNNVDTMGGYFYYKYNNEIKCIEPLQNRGIFFKGNIYHKGSSFERNANVLRECVTWKMILNNMN